MKKTVLFLLFLGILLTGCSTKQIETVYVDKATYLSITIPNALFECKKVDVNGTIKMQSDVALLLVDLVQENEKCFNNAQDIKIIYAEYLKKLKEE